MSQTPLQLALQPDHARLTLAAFIRDVCDRHADRVALRFEGESWTFAELGRRVSRAARGLVGAGVVKGARVGVWMANRPEWVVAAYAAARLGAVVVPINTFAPSRERDYILRHGDVSLLLMQPELGDKRDFTAELLEDHAELRSGTPGRLRLPGLPALRRVFSLGESARGAIQPWSELESLGDDVDEALVDALSDEVSPADDGILIYTSGTTSHPKAVMHYSRAPVIQGYRMAEQLGITDEDVTVTVQPLFWTAGIAHSLNSHLAVGATLVLIEVFDPEAALRAAADERATMVIAWPHQEKVMAEHPVARELDLSRLHRLEFESPLARLVGIERNEWGIYGSYGMSETFTISTAYPWHATPEQRSTNGPPLPGMEIRIADPSTGAPLEVGEHGEIWVRGATLMRGYHKLEPEECFDADGWFATHDGGSLTEAGELLWTGRLSGMIKTGGANVAPLEIEGALDGCPGVSVGFAVGVPHPSLGEIVVLAAVPHPGASVDESRVREHLRERLASYKVPRRVFPFERAQLEFTGTQKVQLESLRQKILERLGAERAEVAGHVYESD